jgi:hypothetical protein
MRELDRLEPEPEPETKEEEDFVWPLPPSSADIVWLEPPQSQASVSDGQSQRSPVGDDKAATPRAPQQPTALPLSRLLSPEVACDWHDAVAVVQQLAEQVTHGGREEPAGSLPDIHRIAIEPNGELRVRLDPRGREPLVRGLGNLLSRLLTNRDSPAAVRLIVSQVMSDLPTIQTAEELVRELARWERPYRIQKIVALYERARNAPDISPTPDLSEIDRLTDPSTIIFPIADDSSESPNAFDSFRDPLAPLRGLKKYRSTMLNVAAVAVCILLASSAAIVMLRSPSSASASLPPAASVETPEAPEPADPATAAAPRAAAPATPVARPGVPPTAAARPNVPASSAAVSRSTSPATAATAPPPASVPLSRGSSVTPAPGRQGGSPQTPAATVPAASAPAARAHAAAPPSSVVTTPAPAATSLREPPAPVATDSSGAQAVDANRTPTADTNRGPQTQPPVRFAAPPSAPRPSVAVAPPPPPPSTDPGFPDRIYTSADPGVLAPVLIRPYLPGLTEQSTVGTRLGVLEVVVDTTGAVESVRLRSPENRYRERWWLFVAKNWQFRPAYKDGQPVRFLTLIPLTDARLTDPQ